MPESGGRATPKPPRTNPEPVEGSPLVELTAVMARLRRECAWKAAQTHRSLARYLLEEAHETVEAIESGAPEHLREELGDLLLQVYFHAAIAAEEGEYDVEDVARDLIAKLVRRNPHVFGETAGRQVSAEEINEAWENIKRTEKRRAHPLEGIPSSLPALLYADKVVDRMQRAGRPLTPHASADGATEVGEELLGLAVKAHALGVDAEQALRDAVRRAVQETGTTPPD